MLQFPNHHSPEHNGLRLRGRALLCLAVACLLAMPGCVRRRLLVRSNPPGAMVYVDNQSIGTTPCATNFIYYGTRELRLVKPGYETLTINQPIPAPWYEIPPLDFVSENLVPREIQDYRTLSYTMQPQVVVPTEQLLGRAQQLRTSTAQGAVTPAAALVPGGALGAAPMGTFPTPNFTPQAVSPQGVPLQNLPPQGVVPGNVAPLNAREPNVPALESLPLEMLPPPSEHLPAGA